MNFATPASGESIEKRYLAVNIFIGHETVICSIFTKIFFFKAFLQKSIILLSIFYLNYFWQVLF